MTIWFVRHSKPDVVPDEPQATWALASVGRDRAAQLGERLRGSLNGRRVAVFASGEAKAIETAELLGLGDVTVDERFGEVAKPWYDDAADHQTAVEAHLTGSDQPDWEPRADALARFDAAIAGIGDRDAVITTHGTVMSLWLSQHVVDFDPVPFWLGLKMPDARQFDGGRLSP